MSQTESLVLGGASLGELCRRYQVKELSLFRSAARGEMRAESDIDLMVEFELGVRMGWSALSLSWKIWRHSPGARWMW